MEKIYVGKLTMADRMSNASVTEKTELRFVNGELYFDDPFKLRTEYYVVKKSDLDAYMARKESLEKTKGTPEWYLSNRLKQLEAENANLRDINKSLKETIAKYYYGVCPAECEIRKENERLKESICLFLSV